MNEIINEFNIDEFKYSKFKSSGVILNSGDHYLINNTNNIYDVLGEKCETVDTTIFNTIDEIKDIILLKRERFPGILANILIMDYDLLESKVDGMKMFQYYSKIYL